MDIFDLLFAVFLVGYAVGAALMWLVMRFTPDNPKENNRERA